MPADIRALYDALIAAWNRRDAAAMAARVKPLSTGAWHFAERAGA